MLPVAVIAEILGVPANMHEQFLAWGHAAAPVLDLGLTHREYTAVNRSLQRDEPLVRRALRQPSSQAG